MYAGAVLLLALLTFCSLVAYAALEEGTSRGNLIEALAFCFHICRFPTHTLFFEYLEGDLFIFTLLFNCLFNGLLIERLISVRLCPRRKPMT